jgi:hypothetical protein
MMIEPTKRNDLETWKRKCRCEKTRVDIALDKKEVVMVRMVIGFRSISATGNDEPSVRPEVESRVHHRC